MEDYQFLADLLSTFRSCPDIIKAIWLLMPPGFLLGLAAIALHYRMKAKAIVAAFNAIGEAPVYLRPAFPLSDELSVKRKIRAVERVLQGLREKGERGLIPSPEKSST